MSNQNGGLGAVVSPLVLRIIGGVVTVAWLVSVVADVLIPTYDPPEVIGLAFMAVLSAVLGAAAIKGADKPEKKGDDDDSQ